MDIDPMHRELTDDFIIIRTKHLKLLGKTPKLNNSINEPAADAPIWADAVTSIKKDLIILRDKISDLDRIQLKRLKVDFRHNMDDGNHPLDAEIDAYTTNIGRLVKTIESNIKRVAILGNGPGIILSAQERTIRLNVMKAFSATLNNLATEYSDLQKKFLLSKKESSEFVQRYIPDNNQVAAVDLDFTDQQRALIDEFETDVSERTQRIVHIAKEVNEISIMMKNLSILVHDQGSILDRIDYNVDNALVDIKVGVREVDEAGKYQEGSMACMLIGAAIMIILIICVVVIAQANS